AAGPGAIAKLGLPAARAAALHGLASAIAGGAVRLDGVRDLDRFVAELTALPGIGPWTAHYLAMRAVHLPDAFPASDLGVPKALLARASSPLPPVREVERRAEAWRPFRAYGVLHLWTSLGDPHADDPSSEDADDRLSARPAPPDRGSRRADRPLPAAPA